MPFVRSASNRVLSGSPRRACAQRSRRFFTTSCSTCTFSDKSATSRLSRLFSASKSRSRFASAPSIPPYCFCHRVNVGSLMPNFWQTCPTFEPSAKSRSACRSFAITCYGLCFLPFIWVSRRNTSAFNPHTSWHRFRGLDQFKRP